MYRNSRILLTLLGLTLMVSTIAATGRAPHTSDPRSSPSGRNGPLDFAAVELRTDSHSAGRSQPEGSTASITSEAPLPSAVRGQSWRPLRSREQSIPASLDPQTTTAALSIPALPEPAAQPLAVRLPIVEYHYTSFYYDGVAMQTEWFLDQMQWLADQGYDTLTINELADYIEGSYQPPERSVALTFDVGISHFDEYVNEIIPALRRFGHHAIFFVQTQGVLDECDGTFTCWPSLAEWYAEGLISIGSHTVYHRDFNTLPAAQIVLELGGSKRTIEEKLGVSVIGVCYPFDAPSPAAFPILESLGYRFAVGGYTRAERSARFADTEPYNLPRYYPYSSEALYPVLSGSGGLTFDELIPAAIAPGR